MQTKTYSVFVQFFLLFLVIRLPLLFLLCLSRFKGVRRRILGIFAARRDDVIDDTLEHILVRRLLGRRRRFISWLRRPAPRCLAGGRVKVCSAFVLGRKPTSR